MNIKTNQNTVNSINNNFGIFVVLYLTSFFCEMTEKWKYPGFTAIFVVLITALVFTKITRLKFLFFLIVSTAYLLIFRFPEVANHVNLILFLNSFLIIGILYSWQKPSSTEEDYWQIMLPLLRFSLCLIYFLAGFHKLNRDFFLPQVSCSGYFFMGGFMPMLTSTILGIPSILFLVCSIFLLVSKLWKNPFQNLPKILQFILLMLLSLIIAVASYFFLNVEKEFLFRLEILIIIFLAIMVIIWELLGGILLIVPKFQAIILLFCFLMHASLALIGFVDFGTLAFALLFTFIPSNYLDLLKSKPTLKLGKYRIHRIQAYFLILLFGSIFTGIDYGLGFYLGDIIFLHGLLLNWAVIILIWPILQTLCSGNRIPWRGVSLWTKQTPKFTICLLLLLFLFGITPYLGLRTAGNFSMFSNLKTEGKTSNHLLLGSNLLKIWDYQEDVVEVIEIDDYASKIGHKYIPLLGSTLPVVEFKKLIYEWTKANYIVPIKFIHDGITYSSPDIIHDPTWRTPTRNWEMYLMDFRVIQPDGPNQCRW